MIIKILIVLPDGRVLKCKEKGGYDVLDNMLITIDKLHEFTYTVWISNTGSQNLKSQEETLRWINEEY